MCIRDRDRAAIQLPGLGTGSWLLGLRVSGQPGKRLTPSRWITNEQQAFDVHVAAHPRIYYFLSHTSSGNLQLSFETARLDAPSDPRNLGLTLYSLQATATRAAIVLPAATSLALLLAMLTPVSYTHLLGHYPNGSFQSRMCWRSRHKPEQL